MPSTPRTHSLILLLAVSSSFLIVSCSPPAATKPEPQATPAPQKPPTDQELSVSLAFPTTIIAVKGLNVTFLDSDQKTQLTLPIDSATKFIGLKSLAEIHPNYPVGIRLSADKKRIFVLNSSLN